MKTTRLDYARFADALAERGLVDHGTVTHVLQQCTQTGAALPEVLVLEQIISDWELSRVSCELYNLPFLPVDSYPPSPDALVSLDLDYLRRYRLVPLDRYGKVLTVAMPGMVPKDILAGMVKDDTRIMPVVGTVDTNVRWLQANLPSKEEPAEEVAEDLMLTNSPEALLPEDGVIEILDDPTPAALPTEAVGNFEFSEESLMQAMSDTGEVLDDGGSDDWGGIFDAGDQAVKLDLDEELPE